MRGSCTCILIGRLAAALVCAAATAGCKSSGGKPSVGPGRGSSFNRISTTTLIAARLEAMAAADTYAMIIAQAADELRQRTKRDEVIDWALQQRVATATACFTNATGPNGFVGLLDMLVYVTLKREAMERYWIPTLVHEEGQLMLEAMRRGERDVWASGARVLTGAQLRELRIVIRSWQEANPTQFYVSHIRFTDFAHSMGIHSGSPQVKIPGSVFGLIYADPLAGLDPVARELQEYRALTERMVYLFNRMPLLLSMHVELASRNATGTPQMVRFVDNTEKFAESTKRFADATTRVAEATTRAAGAINRTADEVVKVPANLSGERKAAIEQIDAATTRQVKSALDQVFAGIAEQRQATVRDLEDQESRLRTVIADVRGVVERADEAGRSINTATGETIGATEQATRRTLNHAVALAILLIVATLLALLLYRLAVKRWVLQVEPHSGRIA
jgi:hypothetical protein